MSAKYYTQFILTDTQYRDGNEFSGVVELSQPMDYTTDTRDIEAARRIYGFPLTLPASAGIFFDRFLAACRKRPLCAGQRCSSQSWLPSVRFTSFEEHRWPALHRAARGLGAISRQPAAPASGAVKTGRRSGRLSTEVKRSAASHEGEK
jgi:hypothetical protein